MKFSGKWIHLKTVIWNEVTQIQKDMHVCIHLQVKIIHKVQDIHSTMLRPKEAKQGESSKCARLNLIQKEGGLNLHKRQMEERERNKKADKYREGDMGEWSEAGVM